VLEGTCIVYHVQLFLINLNLNLNLNFLIITTIAFPSFSYTSNSVVQHSTASPKVPKASVYCTSKVPSSGIPVSRRPITKFHDLVLAHSSHLVVLCPRITPGVQPCKVPPEECKDYSGVANHRERYSVAADVTWSLTCRAVDFSHVLRLALFLGGKLKKKKKKY
jgi:hypothetical protein